MGLFNYYNEGFIYIFYSIIIYEILPKERSQFFSHSSVRSILPLLIVINPSVYIFDLFNNVSLNNTDPLTYKLSLDSFLSSRTPILIPQSPFGTFSRVQVFF